MRIINAKVYTDGHFVCGGIDFGVKINAAGSCVTGAAASSAVTDAGGCYIIPGLVDIHSHGAAAADSGSGNAEDLQKLSLYYAKGGVTSWCPTTMTLKEEDMISAFQAIRSFQIPQGGAKIAGINMEGPFLSFEKRGAQNADCLHKPDIDMFRRLNEASGNMIKLVTVAPEEDGAVEFIRSVSETAVVSIGHTSADYETAMQAFEAGASHVTHLFNAMPPLHHRNPGVIAAALDAGAEAELITDGFHVHPAMIRLAEKLFGEKLILISDSLECAGMPDGDYRLGGQDVELKNGKACLKGTDTLAGSSIHLSEGLRRAVQYGIPLEKAVYAATLAPAKAIGADGQIGSLDEGKAADFVVLDKELNVKAVFIDGRPVF